MENMNGEAMGFDPMARFASLGLADAYLAQHGKAEAFAAIADQGEYILIARKPKADPARAGLAKALNEARAKLKAKAEAKPEGKAKGKGRKGLDQRLADRKAADAEAKAAKGAGDAMAEKAAQRKALGKAGPLKDRRWIGPWAEMEARAKEGKLPDCGPAKPDLAAIKSAGKEWNDAAQGAFSGIFAANTHWPFRKRIAALAALIRAKDLPGLRKLEIKEISTTPIMLGKLRDLAIAGLQAKAEKPAKKANGKAAPAPEAQAQA